MMDLLCPNIPHFTKEKKNEHENQSERTESRCHYIETKWYRSYPAFIRQGMDRMEEDTSLSQKKYKNNYTDDRNKNLSSFNECIMSSFLHLPQKKNLE